METWDGNVSTDSATDTPVIFDATSIYAHNERMSSIPEGLNEADECSRACTTATSLTQDGKTLVKAYFKHFLVSEPAEDQYDRNALYCL